MKILKFRKAFTLAEVLITLVIIGIVAALTIPTAINNTKDQELKSQFAKAYSTITQAIYQTEMNDFFGYVKCYYGVDGMNADNSECTLFYDALAKNLSIQKICNGNSLSDGCIPTYQTYASSGGCGGFSEDIINNSATSFVLSNGQIIIPYSSATGKMALFLVDINGHKGPNTCGKDLFEFKIEKSVHTGLYLNEGGCVPNRGRRTKEMIMYSLAGKK